MWPSVITFRLQHIPPHEYRLLEVEFLHLVGSLYDNGVAVCLPYQPQNLRVAVLAKDDNLVLVLGVGVVLLLYSFLKMK